VRKLSFKIGLLFLVFMLIIQATLFFTLYIHVVQSQVEEELSALLARGNSHRAMLEKHYNEVAVDHVALMESEAETDVVITDEIGRVIAYSNELNPVMLQMIQTTNRSISAHGMIIEKNWKTAKYIASASPIRIHGETAGYVYMFQPTESIKKMIWKINHLFILVGILSLIATVATISLLSRIVASPLVRMKEATERLSKGDFSVSLHIRGNDELASLAKVIQSLANDLNHLKKTRNEFLASISHELRTPLTYVKGYADIARRKELSAEERDKYLAIIYKEALHLTQLVKDLFHLAQLDQHSFTIQKEVIEMGGYIKNIVEKIAPAFREKKMELMYKCPNHLYVSIDPNRFEQVLYNLLDNARKYSNPGSTVHLCVEEDVKHIYITVMDEGIGIPKEDLPFLFERFYRVDKSRARSSGGSGLGLAIAKEIVEAHGGRLSIDSEIGKGTTAKIILERE
jgi:signal transduction histidine kinase